ncbi:unnamed protein product, partial [Ixodes pacificus]
SSPQEVRARIEHECCISSQPRLLSSPIKDKSQPITDAALMSNLGPAFATLGDVVAPTSAMNTGNRKRVPTMPPLF